MDYKYIEQLLERYWECETTLQEEQILRSFFQQEDVPARLLPYRDVFCVQQEMAEEHLGEDFDKRMLELVGEKDGADVVYSQPISLGRRLRPLYQAAGLVALLLTIGTAAQESMSHNEEEESTAVQMVQDQTEQVTDDDVTALPEQQSAVLSTQTADTLEYTR